MANNKNEQQEDSTIEKLNSNLTSASEKIANNSKVITQGCFKPERMERKI